MFDVEGISSHCQFTVQSDHFYQATHAATSLSGTFTSATRDPTIIYRIHVGLRSCARSGGPANGKGQPWNRCLTTAANFTCNISGPASFEPPTVAEVP